MCIYANDIDATVWLKLNTIKSTIFYYIIFISVRLYVRLNVIFSCSARVYEIENPKIGTFKYLVS